MCAPCGAAEAAALLGSFGGAELRSYATSAGADARELVSTLTLTLTLRMTLTLTRHLRWSGRARAG